MSVLFKQPTANILPYVCLSLIVWNLLQNTVNEGAQTFINAGEFMLQVKRPYGVYIFRTVWGNLLISSHMLLVYFIVAFLYGLFPSWTYLLALPGLGLLVVNLVWMAFAAAILSARFRDIPMILQNLFTVLFWLTPVVYKADQLGGTVEQLARLNPLFHILEVARAPLLLKEPALESWLAAAATALIGWALTLLLFARTRRRIVYWM
jgi:ABC-type polysaccharide/polyol phosphate export permease